VYLLLLSIKLMLVFNGLWQRQARLAASKRLWLGPNILVLSILNIVEKKFVLKWFFSNPDLFVTPLRLSTIRSTASRKRHSLAKNIIPSYVYRQEKLFEKRLQKERICRNLRLRSLKLPQWPQLKRKHLALKALQTLVVYVLSTRKLNKMFEKW